MCEKVLAEVWFSPDSGIFQNEGLFIEKLLFRTIRAFSRIPVMLSDSLITSPSS